MAHACKLQVTHTVLPQKFIQQDLPLKLTKAKGTNVLEKVSSLELEHNDVLLITHVVKPPEQLNKCTQNQKHICSDQASVCHVMFSYKQTEAYIQHFSCEDIGTLCESLTSKKKKVAHLFVRYSLQLSIDGIALN